MKKLVIALAIAFSAISAAAQGSKFNVNCDKGDKINQLLNTIATAGAPPPITINVSGTCKESVVIQGFDRLRLNAKPGAVIIGPSKNTNAAVTISESNFVTLQGFLIQGGLDGVDCIENSVCDLTGLTVENATNVGVALGRSKGILTNSIFQNNGGRGVNVVNGSQARVYGGASQGNGDIGIAAVSGSELVLQSVTIQNNVADGVAVLLGSSLRLFDNTISGNGGNGVSLFAQSNASFEQLSTGNVVTGNMGNGLFLRDLSFVRLFDTNNVSGNLTQPDITCVPQFPATRGAATAGGTTDCIEPPMSKAERDTPRP